MTSTRSCGAALALTAFACLPAAQAHVTLPPGGATAGSVYPAAFRVGHACEGASLTTAVTVRVPAGFTPVDAPARPGWAVTVTPGEVRWKADSPATALPAKEATRFVVRGRLTEQPGTLWFKVLQTCDRGSVDWAVVPASADAKVDFPAARLDVLPAGRAPVDVRDAWARSTVPGQQASGVFARLTAGAGATLVGASSPVAGVVEVHEMTMDGDVMRMRALPGGLPLPPADAVALKPGGLHLMLMDLKRPLEQGSTVPLTLRFVDRDGRPGELAVEVPVKAGPAPAAGGHAH